MRHQWIVIGICALLSWLPSLGAAENQNETILIIRHAEKMHPNNGNLSCQGLNRSLKLPAVIQAKFGKPDYILVPNPAVKTVSKKFGNASFYVRPLATIEPTAIYYGLPVNAKYAYYAHEKLVRDLLANPEYENKKIILTWEHTSIIDIIKAFGLTPPAVWPGDDYDSMFIIHIAQGKRTLTRDHEGLNNLPLSCPQ